MKYIKQKRAKTDFCNICGKFRDLTWDHVPPKGTLAEADYYTNTLFDGIPTRNNHMKRYQSGIKYRSICAECNNAILGNYDSSYKEFIQSVKKALSGNRSAESIVVTARINRVLRAICGHFLAMKQEYDNQVTTDLFLRSYIKDETLAMKESNLFCWFYPYNTVLNARDVVVSGHFKNTHPMGVVSVMATQPLGYLLSGCDESSSILDNLSAYSTATINEEVEIILHRQTALILGDYAYKSFAWPLDISDDKNGAAFVIGHNTTMKSSRLGVAAERK